MDSEPLVIERTGPIGRLTLARPEVHNAFDDRLIRVLTEALTGFEEDPSVRCIVLAASGKSFSAGADLNWMQRMASYDEAANLEDARALERLLRTLDELAKPTVARVQGAAMGGGAGLVAACDIAIASKEARFAFSEARLGLVPAVISPFVLRAIGPRMARRYFLTAETFDADTACRMGLVHEVVEASELDRRVERVLSHLLSCGPRAAAESKSLIRLVASLEGSVLGEATARTIARLRASDEGREGIRAFLEKRRPAWHPDHRPDES